MYIRFKCVICKNVNYTRELCFVDKGSFCCFFCFSISYSCRRRKVFGIDIISLFGVCLVYHTTTRVAAPCTTQHWGQTVAYMRSDTLSNCPPRDRAAKRAQLVVVCRPCVYYTSVDSSGTATTKRNKSGDEFAPRISFEGVIEAVEELPDAKRPVKRMESQVRAAP